MTIQLTVKSATITPWTNNIVIIECEGVKISDVIDEVGAVDILDAIGRDYVMKYFNL